MTDPLHVTLPEGSPQRLDKALAAAVPESAGLSRSRLKALIGAGAVRAEGTALTDPSAKVAPGLTLTIDVPPPRPLDLEPEAIPLAILHEDADLIVLVKPAGMVVHPAPGAETGTLVHALLAHCGASLSGIGGARRPGIVHRLDKDTSGVMIVAKTDLAHQALAAAFAAHDIDRVYRALCWGAPDAADPRLMGLPGVSAEPGGLRISARIDRHRTDRKRMAVVQEGGRTAVTHLGVEARFGPPERPVAALISCRLETGRTHQIRVHLSHLGHPLVGDPVYGRPRAVARGALPAAVVDALRAFPRQALHAGRLGFRHPVTGEAMTFEAAPPEDFNKLLGLLRPE